MQIINRKTPLGFQKDKTQQELIRLENKIKLARNDLHKVWELNGGITDTQVLAAAERVDDLLNQYQRLQVKNYRNRGLEMQLKYQEEISIKVRGISRSNQLSNEEITDFFHFKQWKVGDQRFDRAADQILEFFINEGLSVADVVKIVNEIKSDW